MFWKFCLLSLFVLGISARPQEGTPPLVLITESNNGPVMGVQGAQAASASVESTSTSVATTASPTPVARVEEPKQIVSSGGEAAISGAEQSSGGGSGAQDSTRRCWSDSNGYENATWHEEGEQLERGHVWYVCKAGQLEPVGCINEKGDKVLLNDTYVHEQYMMQCQQFGQGAIRSPIGCAPEKQPGKMYLAGETWIDEKRMTWTTCVPNEAWPGGCVDPESNQRLKVGQTMDRNMSTFECQHYHYDGYRMVPIGCIVNGSHITIGQLWEDGEFILYCKQKTEFDEKTTRSMPVGTCIDCILKKHHLFEGDKVFLNEHMEQCARRIAPTGNAQCQNSNDDYEAPQPQAAGAEGGAEQPPPAQRLRVKIAKA